MSAPEAPLYLQAIILPLLAFPSWILCLPPLIWHFRQGNIAASSLILWTVLLNFFNSINPLIWPRDNYEEWWDGKGWCDINVRLQVGAMVGTAGSTVMIVRKLANVMDTGNITVTSGRNSKLREKIWEVVWCWGYPLIVIILYYIVQPARYLIYGISGCISAFDVSWPGIILIPMWAPITMFVAAGYACRSTHPTLLQHGTNTNNRPPCPPSLPLPSRIPSPRRCPQHHQVSLHPPLPHLRHRHHHLPALQHLARRRHLLKHHPALLVIPRPQPRKIQLHRQSRVWRQRLRRQMGPGRNRLRPLPRLRHRQRCVQHVQGDAAGYWAGQHLSELTCCP